MKKEEYYMIREYNQYSLCKHLNNGMSISVTTIYAKNSGEAESKVVKKNTNGSLSCLSYSGYMQNKKEIKDFMLGQSFIKVVINMFSNIQVNGVNPMILAMAEDGIEKYLFD